MAVLFFKKSVPASSSGDANIAGYTSETVHFEPEGFAPRLFEAFLTDDLTAGSVTVTLKKDGVAVSGGVITLDDTTQRAAVSLALGVAAGDRLTLSWSSAAGLSPTTADLLVVVS